VKKYVRSSPTVVETLRKIGNTVWGGRKKMLRKRKTTMIRSDIVMGNKRTVI